MCTDACAIIIDRKQKIMATSPSRNLQTAFAGPIARCRNDTHIPAIAGNGINSIITERVSKLNLSSYNLVTGTTGSARNIDRKRKRCSNVALEETRTRLANPVARYRSSTQTPSMPSWRCGKPTIERCYEPHSLSCKLL
jgi:hypothetical protein